MKTIFDLVGKVKEEEIIKFDGIIASDGEWDGTTYNSSEYKHVIHCMQDEKYDYYLCWNGDDSLDMVCLNRVKRK